MKSREEWMDELARRQDNIDPIRRIPNGALFQGTLIKGTLHLNVFQRIGAILLGLIGLVFGFFLLVKGLSAMRFHNFSPIPELILSPLSIWFSWRIAKNAFVNKSPKHHPRAED